MYDAYMYRLGVSDSLFIVRVLVLLIVLVLVLLVRAPMASDIDQSASSLRVRYKGDMV